MAQSAIKRHGDPITINYTPTTGNVAAGDVVLIGNTSGLSCGIAALAITNNVQGALEVGYGIYEVTNQNNAANGTKVWWDSVNKSVTTTSTNNALFGYVVESGAGGTNTICNAMHVPNQ